MAGQEPLKLEFGVVPKPSEYLPARIDTMYRVYGMVPDKSCKTCVHCRFIQYNKRYYKCDLSNLSHSTATDWRISWTACGKYEESDNG